MNAPTPSRAASYLVVGLVAAAVALVRPGATPLEGHECYVALAAQTMADRTRWLDPEIVPAPVPPNTTLNHWLVPVFNGRPRFEKTPLAYWAAAAPLALGLPSNEFTARLPSALSAVLLAWVTLALGRRLFAPRAALLGALALATTLGFYQWSRNARPEMMLVLWMTAAMLCFHAGIESRGKGESPPNGTKGTAPFSSLWLLAGWFSVGWANCAKEFAPFFLALPMAAFLAWRESEAAGGETGRPRRRLAIYMVLSVAGLVLWDVARTSPALRWGGSLGAGLTMAALFGLPPAWYLYATRGWRQFKPLAPTAIPGVLLMLLLFVPWLWYMAHLFPNASDVLQAQVVGRTSTGGAEFGVKKLWYYLPAMLVLGLPWSVLAAGALAAPFMKRFRAERASLVFLLAWVFGILLLFSAATGKRQHYVLPALPAVALLAGFLLDDLFFVHRWLSRRLAPARVALVAAAALVGVALQSANMSRQDAEGSAVVLLIAAAPALALVGAALVLILKGKPAAALAAFMAALLAGFVAHSVHPLRAETTSVYKDAALEAKSLAGPAGRVASWGEPDGAVIFYYGADIPDAQVRREKGQAWWKGWMDGPRPVRVIVAIPKFADELASAGFVPLHPDRVDRAAHDEPVLFVPAATSPAGAAQFP